MAGSESNTIRAVESALETYQIPWKVIHETLQNSLDSIYKTNQEGNITIEFNLSNQSVMIKDNGAGFPHGEEGKRLLGLHGTDKNNDHRFGGSLGYGLKAVICSTNYFKLTSYINGKKWGFEIKNGHRLHEALFSEFPVEDIINTENGTEIQYSFNNNEVFSCINEMYAETKGIHIIKQYETLTHLAKNEYDALLKRLFEWYFRTNTYAANIDRLINKNSDVPKVNITFELNCTNLDIQDIDKIESDIFSILKLNDGKIKHTFENKFWDIEEFFTDDKGKTRTGLPFTISTNVELPIPSTHELKSEQVIVFKINSIEEYKKLIRYQNGKSVEEKRNDEYFSNKLFDKLQGIYIVIGRNRHLAHLMLPVYPKRQSAFSRGVPTQDVIGLLPGIGESARSDYTIVFLPNLTDEMNLGKLQLNFRKRISWLREFYSDAFRAHFKKISSQVASKEITSQEDFNIPDDEEPTKDYVEKNKIFEPKSERGLIVEPYYENELIALFFNLLGNKDIQGYQFYGLSGIDRYDGKFEAKFPVRDYFRTNINQDSTLWTCEFKVKLSKLVDDLARNKKRATQFHLAIVWEIDSDNIRDENDFKAVEWNTYEAVAGISYPSDKRLPEVNHILAVRIDGRWQAIQVLELKSLVANLNN